MLTRRDALTLGLAVAGGAAGAAIAGCTMPGTGRSELLAGTTSNDAFAPLESGLSHFPARVQRTIEQIVNAKGSVQNGVLTIQLNRNDITDVTIRGTPILPAFEINGNLNFESLGGDRVAMNSDLCLKTDEVIPFIDALLAHDIIFQAEHQHFYDFKPIVWFIHFRAFGDAETIARGCKAAINATRTPLPQAPPKHPTTPLPANEIGKIIGAKPAIEDSGVITMQVPRAESIMLGGMKVNPYLNISAPVNFQPLHGGKAAAVPDFNMIASEIQHVVGRMRGHGWDIGCLYNQETDEHPQLFFSHMFKIGDPLQLAHEIRDGFDLMNVKLSG